MKRPGRTAVRCLMLGMMASLYFMSLRCYRELEQMPDTVSIFCRGGQGIRMEDEKSRDWEYAVWEETEEDRVQESGLNREYKLTVLKLGGSCRVLIPELFQFPADDLDGCYLDPTAAEGLFKSTDVIGRKLVYGDRELTVRGIVQDRKGMMILRPQEGESLSNVVLSVPKDTSCQVWGEEFMALHGIQGSVIDNRPWTGGARFLVLLVPFLAFFLFCTAQRKACLSKKARILLSGLMMAAAGILLVQLQISRDFIPTKWSDFEFFARLGETLVRQWRLYFQLPKSRVDVYYMICTFKCILYGLLSSVLLLINRRWIYPISL